MQMGYYSDFISIHTRINWHFIMCICLHSTEKENKLDKNDLYIQLSWMFIIQFLKYHKEIELALLVSKVNSIFYLKSKRSLYLKLDRALAEKDFGTFLIL